jgi:archaetidylinositol phosphate synthase
MHMSTTSAAQHVRVHRAVTASLERRALVWIAERLPPTINSDHLSALSLLAMACAGLSFVAFRVTPWAALGVVLSLTANWFGDSLDGTVARVRSHQRPRYGFYIDHVIDMAGAACLMAGLAASGLIHPLLAAALLAAYLLVSAETYLATHARAVFQMSVFGVGPTELRVVLAAGAIKVAGNPWIVLGDHGVRLFDIGGLVAVAGLAVAFVVSSIRNVRALYLEEPIPTTARRTA